jgi:hypothetical protein
LSHLLSSLSFSSSTLPSPKNTKLSHPSLSLHPMIKSEQQVQHTLSTAYTAYCIIPTPTVSRFQPISLLSPDHVVLNSLHSHHSEITNEQSLSTRCTVHRPPPSPPPILLDHSLPVHLQTRWITPSKCVSKLAGSHPRSVSPNSLDQGLQVHTIVASKCISKFALSQPPSVSPNSLDYSLQVHSITAFQVHLQTCMITASECISKLARSQPPSLSANSLDYGLEVYTISASKFISKFALSQPPSVSVNSHNHGLGVHR